MNRRFVLRMAVRAFALLLTAGFAMPARAGAPAASYKVGDRVANFAFKDDKGKTVRLSQFKGKVIVLNFFASW